MVPSPRLLRWLYLGRLTLAAGIFGGAVLVWPLTSPQTTLLATLVLLLSIGVTLVSVWHTQLLGRTPGRNFLYAQVLFDTLLVTSVVHLTGGADSDFAPLYIPVIAAGALLLPLPGGVLIGGLCSILYFADIVWLHTAVPPGSVFIQIALFAVLALVTGYLGDRVRQAGTALGAVESELRQLRLDTSDVLATIDTGVVTVDAVGRLVYVNAAAESLLSLRQREWLGRPVLEELDRRAAGLGTIIRRTGALRAPARRHEVVATTAEGQRILGARTTLLEREGDPWVTAVFQDITDGRRVEELNRRAERLEAVAELSASLAHEIKNPLASIRSAVEQLSGRRLSGEDKGVLQRLVVAESDRLSRLLSEFIEFSRVEMKRRAEVDLGAVAGHAIALVRQHPDGGAGARIEFEPPAEPLVIEGDEDLLHRAIFNLVLNAVQHAGGGAVRVELGAVEERQLPAGVELAAPVRIAVSDSGPGIRAEDVPRIFDPFFTRREGGTGLGLALVHRAVEAHRGAIFVDGAPGQGAQFTMYLPARAERRS
ncbi:MAG: PAS domain-containing protein [Gemmatimonadetes bacterium]|nr:PAS domain-containing protein [Gemmatimonadota bacterium]